MIRRFVFLLPTLLATLGLMLALSTSPLKAGAANIKILHTFQGGTDGGQPWGTLLLDERSGILYGTTEVGGNNLCQNYFQYGCGTIFALTPSRNGWTEKILYRFQGGQDGANPRTPLVPRPDGYFYGATTSGGGAIQGGVGTAYRIKPGTWNEETLFRFSSYSGGDYPEGSIAFDGSGDLYGSTTNAGLSGGVVFKLIPSRSGMWSEEVLATYIGTPVGGVVNDPVGNVYGTDTTGGLYHEGSVFDISPGIPGGQFTDLFSFVVQCGMDCGGAQPGTLTLTKRGDLFGFTGDSGVPACKSFGCGTAFEMVKSDGTWKEKTLYYFQNLADGWGPSWGAPAFDSAGNIYGMTEAGGRFGFGTVFKLSRVNGVWMKTTLYSFPGGSGGQEPIGGGVVVDRSGNIFGTTYYGGKTGGKTCKKQGCGIAFEITQ